MNYYTILLNPNQTQTAIFDAHSDMLRQVHNTLVSISTTRAAAGRSTTSLPELYKILNELRRQNVCLYKLYSKSLREVARQFNLYQYQQEMRYYPIELPTYGVHLHSTFVTLGSKYGNIQLYGTSPNINGAIKRAYLDKKSNQWNLEIAVDTVPLFNLSGCIIDPLDAED